jgi:hypothetical protein
VSRKEVVEMEEEVAALNRRIEDKIIEAYSW